MPRRKLIRDLGIVLLIAIGCGGGSTCGGAGGCGGCAGCGGGGASCMAPIPGGFIPELREANAVQVKVTPSGLDFIETQANTLLGGGQSGLQTVQTQDLACTDATQRVDLGFLGSVEAKLYLCDVNDNNQCDPGDQSPAVRPNEQDHGVVCQVGVELKKIDLVPQQNADGTVDLIVNLDVLVKTGRLPLSVDIPLCGKFTCDVEFDSDATGRPEIPIPLHIILKTDPTSGDILAFDLGTMPTLSAAVDNGDLSVKSSGGSGCRFGCDIINISIVKERIFASIQKQLESQIRDAIDSARCLACDPITDACVPGSVCNKDLGICVRGDVNAKPRNCPPMFPGTEGRSDIEASVGPVPGGTTGGQMDLSVVAGGKNLDGKQSTRVQAGGLVVGVLGGSSTPTRARCVPNVRFVPRPANNPLDFDAAAADTSGGLPAIGAYDFAFSAADGFLDRMLYDVWSSGGICVEIGTKQVDLLSSSLFGTFIRSLGVLTHGEEAPVMLVLRPRNPPNVILGRGTTKPGPNGTRIPDDPLITIEMKDLQIDFYAEIEERMSRLFSLVADVNVPLALEFDAAANTITPALAGVDTLLSNVRAENSEMLADSPEDLAKALSSLLTLVEPQIAGALQPIAIPDAAGVRLEIKGARGVFPLVPGPGLEHVAMFAKLAVAPAPPLTMAADTQASLTGFDAAAHTARIAVVASTLQRNQPGFEYAWRIRGGFWSPWGTSSDLDIASPILQLEGRHDFELRARVAGEPVTADATPAIVTVVVDTLPPTIRLERDAETSTLVTVAHDFATPDESLTFRYRVAGADWSDWGAKQAFPVAALEAEVRDGAGYVSAARWGDAPESENQANPGHSAAGCTSTGAGALALLAGLLRRTRAGRIRAA